MVRTWIFLSLLMLFISALARADGFLKPSAAYMIDRKESGGVTEKVYRQVLDFAGGYSTSSGWTILAQYSTEKRTEKTKSSMVETTTVDSRTSFGPGLGWKSPKEMGPFIFGTYYFQNEDTVSSFTYKGPGYQIDVGYAFAIRQVSLGLQLSYKRFDYKKMTVGSTTFDLTTPKSQSNLDPGIALIVNF
jgi:hypothetical protein